MREREIHILLFIFNRVVEVIIILLLLLLTLPYDREHTQVNSYNASFRTKHQNVVGIGRWTLLRIRVQRSIGTFHNLKITSIPDDAASSFLFWRSCKQ
jgi:hypothetical protein